MRKLAVLAALVGLTACKKKGPEGPVNKASDVSIVSANYTGVDKAAAEPVINRSTTGLQACYKKGLAQNPEMGGVVNVQVKVNPKDDTYIVNILDGSKAPKIHDCIKKVYQDSKVPGAGASGGTVDLKVKFGK
jgi:hypothetical protein